MIAERTSLALELAADDLVVDLDGAEVVFDGRPGHGTVAGRSEDAIVTWRHRDLVAVLPEQILRWDPPLLWTARALVVPVLRGSLRAAI